MSNDRFIQGLRKNIILVKPEHNFMNKALLACSLIMAAFAVGTITAAIKQFLTAYKDSEDNKT